MTSPQNSKVIQEGNVLSGPLATNKVNRVFLDPETVIVKDGVVQPTIMETVLTGTVTIWNLSPDEFQKVRENWHHIVSEIDGLVENYAKG